MLLGIAVCNHVHKLIVRHTERSSPSNTAASTSGARLAIGLRIVGAGPVPPGGVPLIVPLERTQP